MPQLSYTEEDVIQAILDVTDNGLSQNQAAQKNEALGYAPSHSQVRATVAALLRQQGRERPIGVHWLARFIKRHDDIKTKVGKRQEAARFNSFTPMAVNWYFDIRESEYGWIKPENTVNVDEGGIMAGFGLDSLVIGSSDPRRKAFLKGSQSRTWTTFIEAVTADGRLLKPGIIFKGKELQQQWFIDELRGSPTVEWLKEVYLPQTQPADESDARLIILDGHRSHVSVAYGKELQKLTSLTDSAPVDKVNFIKAYAKAREVGMTKKNILSGWRVTGNWPISRRKALIHPEIQPDKKETTPGSDGHRDGQVDSDNTPKTSRHIRDLGKNKSPSTRRRYSVISRGFEAQESKIASLSTRIASLEEEVGRLSRGKKRKAIPNPNKRFMTLAEALVAGETISEANEAIEGADAVGDVIEVGGMEDDERSNSEEEELAVLVRPLARMEEKKRRKMVRTMTRRGNDGILEPIRVVPGISRIQSDKVPATDFERRKAEFALMRKIQAQSLSRRRWMAMAISTSSWLVLWLVGAVVFKKSEKPYQDWSYFDSFYFCFEAWTTIGYGDLTPISNAGKSFFVFWSLLALPTMTVLISHASNTVVKFIRDGTLRLGNVTLLPGDEGFVGNMKHIISKITFGKAFPGHLDSVSPEPAESSKSTDQRLAEIMTEPLEQTLQDDDRGRPSTSVVDQRVSRSRCPQRTRATSAFTSRVRHSLSRPRNPNGELPTGADFHFLLISEIQVIATHVKESKPHRYTFDQWAWYLKLIGEDERNAETHRKVKPKGKCWDPNDEDSDKEPTWSWVGNRSPLMGSQEESEWILDRLMDRLRESLSAESRRQLRSGPRVAQEVYDVDGDSGVKEGQA
ncbi:hypothetical protein MRS44_013955 [Fusarium solani]|uniref:uncharacterized protein n=1 Tax=Fusarium solani TaxID=169388 RepID=UPI0032C3F457|nr:hypothetical protein MRS44_013955 [Fusarium solani]